MDVLTSPTLISAILSLAVIVWTSWLHLKLQEVKNMATKESRDLVQFALRDYLRSDIYEVHVKERERWQHTVQQALVELAKNNDRLIRVELTLQRTEELLNKLSDKLPYLNSGKCVFHTDETQNT